MISKINNLMNNLISRTLVGIGILFFIFCSYLITLYFKDLAYIILIFLFLILYLELFLACFKSEASKKIINYIFLSGCLYLACGFYAFFQIGFKMFSVAALCMISDTSAYFFGSLIQGPKLVPKISPNKTISGFVISCIIGIFAAFFIPYYERNLFLIIPLILIIHLGDLLISYSKRLLKIKDSSAILLSHGGLWDRLDSIIAAAIFIMFYNFLVLYI